MKNLLFVIDSLYCGGAEKSLVSLLNNIDFSRYNVDLLLLKRGGEFERYLPKEVQLLESPEYYKYLSKELKGNLLKKILFTIIRINVYLQLKINRYRGKFQPVQVIYNNLKTVIKDNSKRYDVAIGYSQGFPTYYIVDKVIANKRIAWINCDYPTTIYNKDYDYRYYSKIDNMVTVSQYAFNGINNMKYNYRVKNNLIYDIVDPKLIKALAKEEMEPLYSKEFFNIVTVGRLDLVKGYELAINAAKLLQDEGVKFKWYVIGEGKDRAFFEKLIEDKSLKDRFILLGSKANPYPYIRNADLYVQTSIKEGFGLTVIEAKILNKPIVCTDFTTAHELIGENEGVIVPHNSKILAATIKFISLNNNILTGNSKEYSSVKEIDKFYRLIQ